MKKWLIVAGSVVVALIVIALVLPLFINANTFKPTLERDLSSAFGRNVTIGNIRLSVLSGGVSVDSLSVADDPAFSAAPFLTARQLSAGVSLLPLIFSQRLDVSSLTIAEPHITLLRAASGRWNYSSLGSRANAAATPAGPPIGNNFSVGDLKLRDGSITVGAVGSARTRRYANVNLEATHLSYTSAFPFHLSAATPGGGSIQMNGKAGPVNPADASLTPFNLSLSVKNFDLAATGFIPPSAGIGGTVGFDGSLISDGRRASSKGTFQAIHLRLAPDATPATVPVAMDYATTYDLHSGAGSLTEGRMHVGKALASLAGTYNLAGAVDTLNLQLSGAGMPATDLQGVFPAVGVTLPAGATLAGGTLDTALSLTGPLDKLVIAGNIHLANARLAGFNLGSKLGALASFAGLNKSGADTEIQTLSSAVRVDATGTALRNLVATVPAIGTLTGNADISAAGKLDCHMAAKLAANAVTNAIGTALGKAGKSKVGSLVGGALRSLTGGGAPAAAGSSQGGVSIPFRITGTTAHPVFIPGR